MIDSVLKTRMDAFTRYGFEICFPYNQDPDIWEKVSPYKAVIGDFYAGLHPDTYPSLRYWRHTDNAEQTIERLEALLKRAAPHDIGLTIVLNHPSPPVIDDGPLFATLDRLSESGRVGVVVGNLYWGKRLRNRFPALDMCVSTAVNVIDQYTALIWKEVANVQSVAISRYINKNIERIRDIRELGVEIKMVVSDLCTPACPNQHAHEARLAAIGASDDPKLRDDMDAILRFCMETKSHLPAWHWAKKEVLPFHLPKLSGLVDTIKLFDRDYDTETNLATLRHYLMMESDIHHHLNYREPYESFDKLSRCNRTCHSCTWCRDHIEMLGEEPTWDSHTEGGDETPVLNAIDSQCAHASHADIRPAHSAEKQETPTLDSLAPLVALRALKSEFSAKSDRAMYRLLADLLKIFSRHIAGDARLGRAFRLARISQPIEHGIGITWSDGERELSLALTPPDYSGDVAIRTPQACVILIDADNNETAIFRSVQHELRSLLS